MTWQKIKIRKILTESKVPSDSPDPDKRITVKLNVKGVEKRPFENGIEGGTKYYIRRAGQFIYGKQNLFKGAFGIIPSELDGFESSSDIPTFDIHEDCLSEWIFYFLKQGDFYKSLEGLAKGTGSKRIHPEQFFDIDIPFPSREEQQEIIKKIKSFETKYDTLQSELKLQSELLTQLRQAILREAVQGKLVPQDPADEPASELLKRIRAEKEQLIREGKLKKEKPLPPITPEEIPFELPQGWVWCRLGDVTLKSESGKSFTCEKYPAEYPEWGVIKVSAISWDAFNEKENKALLRNTQPTLAYQIHEGDYLISRANTEDLVGKSVVVGKVSLNVLLSDKSIRFLFSSKVDKHYINLLNNSSIAREYYKEVATGTSDSMKNISREQMYSLLIPLPPFAEQNRIVEKVESLMTLCTQLEAQITTSQQQAEQLMQTVLRDAFTNPDIMEEAELLGEEKATLFETEQLRLF
ncbi:restriction endonuclease subunit S [Xanthocytophaga agilis]|uniref:Restriction endonuclease subunit S n=1 Tax=Xanthocytophaga agilis TaxID=3048010 RepID=A0AAE3RCX9_9BACT|nr:restriction endonuclease subunit S [Xanthocytophaga agilis]MDJ1505582.1 restriction endonuclease subunit S [Xanthocytophaga agilis]